MDLVKLEKILGEDSQPKFRINQIKKAIYQDGVSLFCEISTLPKDLREELDRKIKVLSFSPEKILKSMDGQSIKALLKLDDGNLIETVLISPKPETWSACISSQVGCPLGCGFCATGRGGFKRNLTTEEITDQVLFWRQYIRKNKIPGTFSNIVYMGMGEPFLNWEEVSQSLKDLTDSSLFGFGSRSISVSTAGIPEGIEKLAKDFPQINLAISLHFGDDIKRSQFMPINIKYPLIEIKKAINGYFRKTRRKIFIEYIMMDRVNDSQKDADDLVRFVRSCDSSSLLHINLIRYNSSSSDRKIKDDDEVRSSSFDTTQKFRDYLLKNRINVTIRKSLGEDIQGACGQLAGKK